MPPTFFSAAVFCGLMHESTPARAAIIQSSIDDGMLKSRSSVRPLSATESTARPMPWLRPARMSLSSQSVQRRSQRKAPRSLRTGISGKCVRSAMTIVPKKNQKNATAPGMPISAM